MSAISRTSGVAGAGAPNRTYIAMRGYVNDFFSYTTSINNDFLTTGTLAPVVGATNGNCLTGDLLRETGKRLYPGANPGVNTLMVSVFNFATGLKGFIDPNSLAFTPQNTDRPYYIDSAGYNPNSSVDSARRNDQGPPVITQGDVIASGDLEVSGDTDISGSTTIYGDTYLNDTQIGKRMYYSNSVLDQDGTSTLTINFGNYSAFRINITSSDNFQLNATGNSTESFIQPVYIIFNNPNNYTPTIVFGNNIREEFIPPSSAQSLTLIGYYSVTMSLISFGGNLLEMSRMIVNNA